VAHSTADQSEINNRFLLRRNQEMTDIASREDVNFIDAPDVRKGDLIVLKGICAKVKEIHWACNGKHGASKYRIVAYGLFNNKRVEETVKGHDRVVSPRPQRYDADVIALNGDELTVYDTWRREAHSRLSLDDDDELHSTIRERIETGNEIVLDILAAFGDERIMAFRPRKVDEQ
jgi:translation elongation factor P/translation initiation factor 5A